jgi:hypothetical protein
MFQFCRSTSLVYNPKRNEETDSARLTPQPTSVSYRERQTNMQRSFTALIALFSLIGSAQARIGDTEVQIRTRYGEAITVLPVRPSDAGLTKCYSSERYIISVTYVKGRSVREILSKPDNSKITEAEIQTALKANAGGSGWNGEPVIGPKNAIAGVRQWRTGDQGSRVAFYDSQTRALFITTQQFIDLTKATKRRQVTVRGPGSGLGALGGGLGGGLSARAARNMNLLDKGAVLGAARSGQPQPSASPSK